MWGIIFIIVFVLVLRRIFFPKSKKLFGGFLRGSTRLFGWVLKILWHGIVLLFKFLFFVVPRLIYWCGVVVLEFLLLIGKSLKLLWELLVKS